MQFRLLLINLILLISLRDLKAKTVVFLPMMATSHVLTFERVAMEMSKLGHHVWLALPSAFEDRRETNKTIHGVNTFSYTKFLNKSENILIEHTETTFNIGNGSRPDMTWLNGYSNRISAVCFKAMSEGGLTDFVQSLKPDLVVIDWYPRVNELVILPYSLHVSYAIISPEFDFSTARIPFNPIEITMNSQHYRTKATLLERWNMIYEVMYPLLHDLFFDRGYVSKLVNDRPHVTTSELMSRAEVFIVASDHILDYPRPSLPNVKFVGAISAGPPKDLEEPFKTFMNKSDSGVAVVSFGSLILNLPDDLTQKLLESFKMLRLNVVWRANMTSPLPDKVLTSLWIPQNDLLGHRNTKVFISHCGSNSQHQALYHGVPVVCLPLFYDQFYNSERFDVKNFSKSIDPLSASVDSLVSVYEEVAFGEKYKQAMASGSEIYHQIFKNPKGEAAFWLDHVLRYGGASMRSNTQRMTQLQYVQIYFIAFLAGILTSLAAAVCVCFVISMDRICLQHLHYNKQEK